jgi:hypothetical protein
MCLSLKYASAGRYIITSRVSDFRMSRAIYARVGVLYHDVFAQLARTFNLYTSRVSDFRMSRAIYARVCVLYRDVFALKNCAHSSTRQSCMRRFYNSTRDSWDKRFRLSPSRLSIVCGPVVLTYVRSF